MDILKEMLRQNPWWRDANSINKDEKIVEWAGSLRYEPRLMYRIQYYFADDRTVIYTLRGPRQVGKTTLVKLQIKKFLDRHVHPLRILYCTMDIAQSPREVDFVLDDGGEMRIPVEVKSGNRTGAADLAGLTRFAHNTATTGVALSKSRMAEGNYLVVPASVFLALV